MLLDELLPTYDFVEVHARDIAAPPERVYATVRELDFSGSWVTRSLLFLRGIPTERATLASLKQTLQFTAEREDAPRELAMAGVYPPLALTAAEFVAFVRPGLKMAWNFTVTPSARGAVLRTETRVQCISARTKRLFSAYWFFIRPFSGLIRLEMLRCAAEQVEAKR